MPPSKSEQTLEWTFQYRPCGMDLVRAVWDSSIIVSPLLLIRSDSYLWITVSIILMGALSIIMFACLNMYSQTLRVSRNTITLTITTVFITRERRMDTAGAKYRTGSSSFFLRLRPFGLLLPDYAYYIEIVQNGKTFLFPCADEKEQLQIAGKIKELGLS